MKIQEDFKELLRLFNESNVEYIVVGGYALAYYGVPRYTGDIDLWVKISKDNAKNILSALHKFGFGSVDVTIEDLSKENQIVQLGYPPVRIDLLTSIDGLSWVDASKNVVQISYDDVPVLLIGKNDFIKNKKASGRHKDLADIEALGEEI